MFSYKNKILERISKYAKDECELLDKDKFILGDSYFNDKCYLNTVHYAKRGLGSKVLACICVDKNNFTFLHFINVDANGNYIDNTLGWLCKSLSYYLYDTVPVDEIQDKYDIDNYYATFRKELVNNNSNKFLRKLFSIKYDIV